MKRVIVIGSKGQDGRLLCEQLQRHSCAILGISKEGVENSEAANFPGVEITNPHQVLELVKSWMPDEIYYLAAFHHSSQDSLGIDPLVLYDKSQAVHVAGLLHFLDAIRLSSLPTRLFYAASSLVFGDALTDMQNEQTPILPRCIYGITKASGVHCCRFYRNVYGVYAATGFLFNHESPYRAEKFVSKKIIQGVADVYLGCREKLVLGDLSARIDWGYAPDFVDAMRRILVLPNPEDFVVATGEAHSVQEFVRIAFSLLGLNWESKVEENSALLKRRNPPLIGDASKLRQSTGWQPSVSFEKLVGILLDAELATRSQSPLAGKTPSLLSK